MKLTVRQLKLLIEKVSDDCWGGSHPDETYDQQLVDDPKLKRKSVYVPDDVKRSIRKWSEKMGLSRPHRKTRS